MQLKLANFLSTKALIFSNPVEITTIWLFFPKKGEEKTDT